MKKITLLVCAVLFFVYGSYGQTGNIIIPSGNSLVINRIIPDRQGKYLYSTEDEKIVMWDIKTHDQLYTFPVGKGGLRSFVISNDGTKIVVNGYTIYSTVTGKLLFNLKISGTYVAFSPDDSKLYSINYNGEINELDIKSLQVVKVIDPLDDRTGIDITTTGNLVITNRTGWQIWDTAQKKMVFEYRPPAGTGPFNYLPNMDAMVTYVVKNYSQVSADIYDVYTGKLLKSVPGKGYVIPAEGPGKQFVFNHTIYDASFTPVGQLKINSRYTVCSFIPASNTVYASDMAQIFDVNTNDNHVGHLFNRKVADLGMSTFNSMEYSDATGILNIMTDDSVFKSINLVKLMPIRHKVLPVRTEMTTFSATGDTVAVFDDHKGYIKNIVTGKMLQPFIKLTNEASSNERANFFFSKNGANVYYTTFSVPRQLNTLYRINVKTGISQPVFNFKSTETPYLHPDKDLLAGMEKGYQYNHAKVWNINTGAILFDKDIPDGETTDFISISADKKNVLLVRNSTTEKYNLSDGSLESKSAAYPKIRPFGVYSCTPDLSLLFALNYDGEMTAYDIQGKPVYTKQAHLSAIRKALFAPDSKTMYTVSLDHTIKVWQPQTGKLLGTIYLFNDGNDFVFIDQYGRFEGTDAGIKKLYYYSNRRKVPLDVVYEKFYTPNLYQRSVNGEQFDPIDVVINPSPLIKISYAQVTRNLNVVDDKIPAYQNTTGIADITVKASAENDKVDEIRLFQNGKIVNMATRGLFVTDNTTGTDSKTYTISLLPGVNNIRAVALNGQRTESEPDEIMVTYNSGAQANAPAPVNKSGVIIDVVDRNATMHLVVVGINAYKNPKMRLNYALADATSFKDVAEQDAKTMITGVKTYFVTDDKADKSGILAALTEVQKNAKPQDVFVFYYAGHGVISDKNKEFYLVPNDVADLNNVDAALAQHGISSKMLQQYAIDIAAQKQVFILDACQSAGAFSTLLTDDADRQKSMAVVARSTGTHWIAASGSQQFANEFSQLGHGAFTYVLLKAMKGGAASNKMITINGLKNYLQVQVPDLMKKYNGTPQYPSSYGLGDDFPVEVIK
ncbi:caspase family protein [Mucilaginibacter sp.]|uniref:caspase family protein n=1 Tax=Mucilaginibacter sp. TaxID=1882438 RepID=UPI0025D439B1|nr:caspase family protein [Mucilaginibacter sp.]